MKINGFNFSPGNSKLGKIWNFSLPPIKSCPKGVPCANSKGCYAHKAYRLYPSTKKAWDENLAALKKDAKRPYPGIAHPAFYNAVKDLLFSHNLKYFRIHVAGDFISQSYMDQWQDIAREHSKTKFLAFTKNTELDYSNLPKNLVIRFSMWPGWAPLNIVHCPELVAPDGAMRFKVRTWTQLPKAYVDPGTGAYRNTGEKRCPSSCTKCKYCWNSTGDVVFKKH